MCRTGQEERQPGQFRRAPGERGLAAAGVPEHGRSFHEERPVIHGILFGRDRQRDSIPGCTRGVAAALVASPVRTMLAADGIIAQLARYMVAARTEVAHGFFKPWSMIRASRKNSGASATA